MHPKGGGGSFGSGSDRQIGADCEQFGPRIGRAVKAVLASGQDSATPARGDIALATFIVRALGRFERLSNVLWPLLAVCCLLRQYDSE